MTIREFNNLTVGSLIRQNKTIYEILSFNKRLNCITIKTVGPQNSIMLNEIYSAYPCGYLTIRDATPSTEWHVVQINSIYDKLISLLKTQ